MKTRKSSGTICLSFLLSCAWVGGIILNGCTTETITADGTDLLVVEPETVVLSGNGDSKTVNVTSKFTWNYSLSCPDDYASNPFSAEQTSESELRISAQARIHDGGLVFDSYTGVLEIYCPDHPEVRKEVTLRQNPQAPVFNITPADSYSGEELEDMWEGLENGFEVPESGKTYEFVTDSNFPVEVLDDCDWINVKSTGGSETSTDNSGTRSYSLSVEVLSNPDFEGRKAGIKIGSTVSRDGEEVEIYQSLTFVQGELSQSITLDNLGQFSEGRPYNNVIDYITISSNCDWTVSSDADWIRFSTDGSSGNAVEELAGNPDIQKIYFHYDVNFDEAAKSGEVHILSQDNTVSHTIQVTLNAFAGIKYTTTDGRKLMISENGYAGHIFEDGTGKIALRYGNDDEVYSGAFNNCSTLKKIWLQPALGTVGSAAFSGCTSLEEVVFTNSSFNDGYGIETSVFFDCISLVEIDIPRGAVNGHSIGSSTFENCTSLREVRWGDDVTYIGQRAFYGCESLEGLTDRDGSLYNVSVHEYAFYNCKNFTSAVRLQPVTYDQGVGKYAFYGCSSLSDVQFETDWGLSPIGDHAFYYCRSLRKIQLPETLREIGSYAFALSGLEKIECEHDLRRIGACAFYYCRSLTDVKLGRYIEFVGTLAFADCNELASVVLECGHTMKTTFGRQVFSGDKNLGALYLNYYTPPTLTNTIFGRGYMYAGDPLQNSGFRIYVPEETLADYEKAEFWKDWPLEGVPSSEFYK